MKYTSSDAEIARVCEELPPHTWRTEIPNIVLELGLSPYELTLYVHLKKTAGDNMRCTKGTRRLAEETGMSLGQVQNCKESLAKKREQLGDKPLIMVREFLGDDNKKRHEVIIVDIWGLNIAKYKERKAKTTVHGVNATVHTVNDTVHGVNEVKNLENKEPIELFTPISPQGGGGVGKSVPVKVLKEAKSNLPTSEGAIRIAQLFGRRLTTEWSESEIKAYKKLHPLDLEDLGTLERYYQAERAKKKGIHRRDLKTFLNNYPGELDRANQWQSRQRPKNDDGEPELAF